MREFLIITCRLALLVLICLHTALTGSTASAQDESQDDVVIPLIDQRPFDRIVLNEANDNAVIDVQLLDLPNRQVPNPLPENGTLDLRRLIDPSVLYSVKWSDIAEVQLYEQLILAEAEQLIVAERLDEAYIHLKYLHDNYPTLSGLEAATALYLQKDAMSAFRKKQYDESLAILSALYDLNPQRRGLAKAIEGVSDQLISMQLTNRNFRGAREMLDSLRTQFPDITLTNLITWQEKFASGAQRQLEIARQAIASGDFSLARQSVQRAVTILPDIPGARELFDELERLSPQIVVAVAQQGQSSTSHMLEDWSDERVSRLTNPRFVELVSVGPEGGEYSCRWADIKRDTSGLKMEIKLNSEARQAGITPEKIALHLLRMADPEDGVFQIGFAGLFARVEISAGETVVIHMRRPHVKPIAFLRFPISELHGAESTAYFRSTDPENSHIAKYHFSEKENEQQSQVIVEQTFQTDEEALSALGRGDVDVLDQIPPWNVEQVSQLSDVDVSNYRVPTIHVLLCNYDNPLMKRREFRRGLCYGIDRPRMVAEVLGAKDRQSAFRVLSGPLPAGITFNDAIGYAYKQDLQPLPYEPRLAVVLAASARATLAKQKREMSDESATDKSAKSAEKLELADLEPLVLMHPADPVSRTMCQLIKRQLDTIGIPVELVQQDSSKNPKWDLRYAELCLWEPIVDTRSLLGPGGLAGYCSPTMNLMLNELDQATNWSDVSSQFHRIHQTAFDDLPVIPLWQTLNSYAQRQSLSGLNETPVSLYQNVSKWHVAFDSGGNLQ